MVKAQVSFVQDPQALEVSRPRLAPLQRQRCSPHMTSTFEAEIGQLGRLDLRPPTSGVVENFEPYPWRWSEIPVFF